MANIPDIQYDQILRSRKVVFDYCKTFAPEHYTQPVEHFGRGGSIRNLHVHTANTYIFWLINFAMHGSEPYFEAKNITSIDQTEAIFARVDDHVRRFLKTFNNQWEAIVANKVPRYEMHKKETPLLLFTHAITHEFHHKGQIMTMSRVLGYEPPDADVLRF